jgi:hypothetical protein
MSAEFFKIRKNGVISLHAVNGLKQLMVIPQQDNQKNGEIQLTDKDFYPELYREELKEPISMLEFLYAAGDVTAGVTNFFSRLTEAE